MELLWPILDLLVVTAGFYGSGSSPEMVSIRSGTFWGPVFGCVEVRLVLKLGPIMVRSEGVRADSGGVWPVGFRRLGEGTLATLSFDGRAVPRVPAGPCVIVGIPMCEN